MVPGGSSRAGATAAVVAGGVEDRVCETSCELRLNKNEAKPKSRSTATAKETLRNFFEPIPKLFSRVAEASYHGSSYSHLKKSKKRPRVLLFSTKPSI